MSRKVIVAPTLSLRDKIKAFRRSLHGEAAATFDEVFCEISGMLSGTSLKECLSKGKNLQKAWVAAKDKASLKIKDLKTSEIEDELDE